MEKARKCQGKKICFIEYSRTFVCITNCGKFLKRWEYQTTIPVSWEICMWVKKQQISLDTVQEIGSKLGRGYNKAAYCHPPFNFYSEYIMWNARLDELQAGIKIARRNINNLRYADDTTLIVESDEELKSLLMRVKEESGKAGLKLSTLKKLWSGHLVPSLHGKQEKKWKHWQILFSWASKSLWMVTAAVKLKDACSLEEKIWQP